MDTKPLELEALNEIESKVARYGYKYARINYDEDGGDLYIIEKCEGNTLSYLRCQSKGRSIYPSHSSVVIPKSYISEDFLVFVYVKPMDLDDVETYLYTANDIVSVWEESEKSYSLYLSKDFISEKSNDKYLFKKDRALIIRELLTSVGRKQYADIVRAMSEIDFYFNMWRKTGGLPSIEYLRDLSNNEEMLEFVGMAKFVFLICALIIQNQENDISLSVDWAYSFIKNRSPITNEIQECKSGKTFFTYATITYYKTWVRELLSNEGNILGYQLHMADDEESVNACVWR